MIKRLLEFPDDRYHRPHDNWIEVPVQTVTDDGELKTVLIRRRSLRKKRQIFTISCTAFTIGCLMIIFSSPYRNQFLVPGPLTSNHGQILAGQGADRCAACHGAADGSLSNWISSTFAVGKTTGLSQSELCMKCHEKTLAIETALNPHNVAPKQLAQLTSNHNPAALNVGMVFRPPVHDDNIACSVCHREHHGSNHDLAAMTDRQCQTCHQNSFHDFSTDHPEFANYSQKRRSRIAFDHSTHSLQHFPSKKSEFNCSQCHVDDSFQNVKRLASYEQACASCHHQQVLDSGHDGLALIALPMLDTEAIETANLKIGSWPLSATGDFDGPIPPIMRVLLTADPKAAEILDRHGTEFDFADIDPADIDQVGDAVELVWAIKRLLYDLSLNGPAAIRKRLESVTHVEISGDELQKMLINLDEPVFQNAVRRWLPNLNVEVAVDRFAPDRSATLENQTTRSGLALQKSNRNWWPSDEDLLMRIGTRDDLLATNPIAGLVEPLTTNSSMPVNPVVRIPDTKVFGQQDLIKKPLPQSKPGSLRLKNSYTDPMNDPDLLAINPLQLSKKRNNPRAQDNQLPKIVTPPPPQPGLVNQQDQSKQPLATDQANVAVHDDKIVKIDGPATVVPSGWIRNDELFRISYLPSGHADECLQSWIELVTRVSDADTRSETIQLFKKTISMNGIGLCRNCHTVDQLPDRSFTVNWDSKYRDPSVRSFTRFAHGPHMIQPNLQDCSYCHTLDLAASNHESFLGVDSTSSVSNFLPITKSNCATCHQENQANSSCTQCHNYHIGSRVTGTK